MNHPFRRTPPAYNHAAVETLLRHRAGRPITLDSGCGTGESSLCLAQADGASLVVGIDQSAHRLARGRRRADLTPVPNLLLLRADAGDVWALLAERGIRVARHLLLYPNPWPKAAHLQRRWHGHPRWPALLALGGQLEMRSNWAIYAQEFALALAISGHQARIEPWEPGSHPLTAFERKYMDSGHALWRVTCDLDAAPAAPGAGTTQAGNTPVDR